MFSTPHYLASNLHNEEVAQFEQTRQAQRFMVGEPTRFSEAEYKRFMKARSGAKAAATGALLKEEQKAA